MISLISVLDLRFRLPKPIPAYTGKHDAIDFGPSCPQPYDEPSVLFEQDEFQTTSGSTAAVLSETQSEDCAHLQN